MICQHCGRPLRKQYWSSDDHWKSCPNCSGINGNEHVFYRYPDDFGTTSARATDRRPEGPQNYCSACRGNRRPDLTRSRLCHQID